MEKCSPEISSRGREKAPKVNGTPGNWARRGHVKGEKNLCRGVELVFLIIKVRPEDQERAYKPRAKKKKLRTTT